MDHKSINFVLVGVGGQGTILASDVLAELGLKLGYDVKKAEVHGMSQRGGSVVTYVKFADKVYSPVISEGEADIILAFEQLEAYRYIKNLSLCKSISMRHVADLILQQSKVDTRCRRKAQ